MRLGLLSFALLFAMPAQASVDVLFPVEVRRSELTKPEFAAARSACEAPFITLEKAPPPIAALKSSNAYGNDNSAEPFGWYVMVQSGRALAGDAKASKALQGALLAWADAHALEKSEGTHSTHYAMKRIMLPTIVAFGIVRDEMDADAQAKVHGWIDRIVRRLDKKFDGDVDHNNHRYLADATLQAWGAFEDDAGLYEKGIARYKTALAQMGPDGGLPLEVRRGARAQWYMRQSLANLTVMAEIARVKGDDLYSRAIDGRSIDLLLSHFLNGVENPLTMLPEAAKNYIPGPEGDFFKTDLGMLEMRPNGRHYMAFAEAYLLHHGKGFNADRLQSLMQRTAHKQRPLIDDFSGGNATCFWWRPA